MKKINIVIGLCFLLFLSACRKNNKDAEKEARAALMETTNCSLRMPDGTKVAATVFVHYIKEFNLKSGTETFATRNVSYACEEWWISPYSHEEGIFPSPAFSGEKIQHAKVTIINIPNME